METKEVKLGDIVKYNKGYAFKSSEYTDEGVMVVRVTDFTLDSISDADAVYLAPDDRYDKFILKTNDILIQTVGSWANNPNSIVGKVVRVPKQCDSAYLNQNIVRIIPNNDFDNTYLFYALKANQFSTYCVLRGQGAANQASITLDTIFRFKFKVHNFAEQKRIADILTTYDNLIENNNKRIKLLEQMVENLYKEWFVRFRFLGYEDVEFENGIPNEWEIKRLFEFGKIETGKTPSKERDQNYGGDIMFIKTPDMHDNIYVISTDEFLSTEGHLTQPKKLLPENSIMVSCIGTGGVVAINDKPAHTNQQINSIILNKSEYLEWLYFVCKNLKETIEMFGATGSTMTNLSKGKFEKLKIVSPPEKVILEYHELTKNLFIEVRVLLHKNELLTKQRDMLLPRLMSGKLEV